MKELEPLLHQLGRDARREAGRKVDVRARVLQTIAARKSAPQFDLLPMVFSGFAVAAAVALFITCFPSWRAILDPWASYLVQ